MIDTKELLDTLQDRFSIRVSVAEGYAKTRIHVELFFTNDEGEHVLIAEGSDTL